MRLLTGVKAKQHIEDVIAAVDGGTFRHRRPGLSRWVAPLAGSAAIGLVMSFSGCTDATETETETTVELCSDRIDNDDDGLCDCQDDGCADLSTCQPACPAYGGPYEEENCSDCRDGYDCDGLIDCEDPDCDGDPACAE